MNPHPLMMRVHGRRLLRRLLRVLAGASRQNLGFA
jgi:hypothetical protein